MNNFLMKKNIIIFAIIFCIGCLRAIPSPDYQTDETINSNKDLWVKNELLSEEASFTIFVGIISAILGVMGGIQLDRGMHRLCIARGECGAFDRW